MSSSEEPLSVLNIAEASIGAISARLEGDEDAGRSVNSDGAGVVTLTSGDEARVSLDGVAPGSEVEVLIFSTPRLLGTAVADSLGRVLATLPLPRDLEIGMHTVVLTGRDAAGMAVRFEFPVYVVERQSGGQASLLVMAAMVLIGFLGAGALLRVRPARSKRELDPVSP